MSVSIDVSEKEQEAIKHALYIYSMASIGNIDALLELDSIQNILKSNKTGSSKAHSVLSEIKSELLGMDSVEQVAINSSDLVDDKAKIAFNLYKRISSSCDK
ncbi:hypothetical protein A3715_18310 [Oleiphilus sp. HI0009]|nr:hypothetical protein A3715_18310 [Oleiphilus sp. HI0009]